MQRLGHVASSAGRVARRPSPRLLRRTCVHTLSCILVYVALLDYTRAEFAKPKFDDITLDPSVSRKTDLCGKEEEVRSGSVPLRDVLRGSSLSAVFPRPEGYSPEGFFAVDGFGAITDEGLMTEILDELSRRAGFEWRNNYGFFIPPKTGDNYTWTDCLVWSASSYDISVEWWGETVQRKEKGVTYPIGFYDASIILVTPAYGASGSSAFFNVAFSFLLPFSPELWVLVIALWLWCGLVYWFVEQTGKCRNKAEFTYEHTWQNILLSIYNTSLEFAGCKWHNPKTFSGRLFSWAWLFARLLLMASYSANLASTFVRNALVTHAVSSVEEAISKNYVLCAPLTTFVGEALRGKYPNANFKGAEGKEIFASIQDGSCAAALIDHDQWRTYQIKTEQNPNCGLEYVGRPLMQFSAGFAVIDNGGCTSLLRRVFDVYLQEMTTDGFIDATWDKYLANNKQQDCITAPSGPPPRMLPENVAGLFMLVIMASIAAIALAHTDFCTFCDKQQVASDDGEGNLQEELMKVVAQLQQDQAASNARFEKAMSIIKALQKQGDGGAILMNTMPAYVSVTPAPMTAPMHLNGQIVHGA